MTSLGHVHNGLVVLEGGASFPEGARVSVSLLPDIHASPRIDLPPGELPAVHAADADVVYLTNDRIHEILDADDVEAVSGQMNAPA